MATLAQKLGLREGQRICLLDAPDAAVGLLRAVLAPATELDTALGDGRYDLIFLWPTTADGLAGRFAALQRRIPPEGAIWAVLPKRAVARRRGIALTWETMQAAALTTALVDNKIATLTDEDYGTRFVIRKERRGAYAGELWRTS
ncbi:MAG: hypothetical protein ACHQ4H_07635 [Ktedonobacterales bacterium]